LFLNLRAVGEENTVVPEKRARDRRIQKTEKLLHGALAELIREKPYDSIVVKEILDRANVGRSTFYTHFRDKDDLLVHSIHDLIGSHQAVKPPASGKQYERIIAFSLPIFEHIHEHRQSGDAKMGSKGRALIHEHLREVLGERIADDLKKSLPGRRKAGGRIPPDVLVPYVASTFILVLNWWVESANPLPPNDVNDMFRALVLPTLAAVWPRERGLSV
jgi:AcrR family transcriptional regulator